MEIEEEGHKLAHVPISNSEPLKLEWTEQQLDQLKNQIIAYKCLLSNVPIPSQVLYNIRTYSPLEWEKQKIKQINENQKKLEEKFNGPNFTIKELNNYFKNRYRDDIEFKNSKLNVPNIAEKRLFTVENQMSLRQKEIENYLCHITETEENKVEISKLKRELQLLRVYQIQKNVRKEVATDFISDYEKKNEVNVTDSILFKMMLDRRAYKKPVTVLKKDQKIYDKFEQQLRNGYDMRKKEKQKKFLIEVLEYQKSFKKFHDEKMIKLKKRVQMCKSSIENIEVKDKRERERRERERIQFLKQNNMEEYKKMLKEAKDSRLEEFMNQTDQFLKEIEDKIDVQKENIQANNDKSEKIEGDENYFKENLMKNTEKIQKELEEIKDEQIREKVTNSKNYYLSAHSKFEEILEQPKMLKFGHLKTYQIAGLQWLVSLYVNNLNGILADEMGLGKTIQTIALLSYVMETKHNEGPFLIIAPLATISNWVIEFNRWAPSMKIVVYKGAPAYRRQLAQQIKAEKHKFNVVLTTYEYIMKDKYSLNKVLWQYIIVDEGHRMKNYKSKFTQTLGTQFNSVYRLLLTGTPLQNNLTELWALLNFLLPKIFNSAEDFEKWFNQPFSSKLPGEKNTELTEEQELLIINRLHTVLRPFLLRREKKDVEKELPSKTEYVIKLEISAWQKVVYDQIKGQGLLAEDPTTGRIGRTALMNTVMQLRKICNHPYLFLHQSNSLLEEINDWIFKSSGKFEFLDRILPKLIRFDHKVLIFSQMTQLLNILELYFLFKGIKFLRLDGNTKADERGSQIEKFSKEKSDYMIFILSTRAGGLGLNLQAADTVIIFDSDWNPQMDIQAQDRAHRIGQTREVKVFRLISKKTIEEGILEKAAFKKNMDEKVIRAGLYNSKYSENERREKLLDIIKNENKEEEEEDEILNDEQINEYLARSEEELSTFTEMDKERYINENKENRMKEIKEKSGLSEEQMKNVNYRLLQDFEIPDWIKISKEDDKEEKIEEVEIGGKEMRVRKHVNYREDFYDQEIDEILDSESDTQSNINKKRKRLEKDELEDSEMGSYSYKGKKKKKNKSIIKVKSKSHITEELKSESNFNENEEIGSHSPSAGKIMGLNEENLNKSEEDFELEGNNKVQINLSDDDEGSNSIGKKSNKSINKKKSNKSDCS